MILSLFLCILSYAEPTSSVYELQNLRPQGFSQYSDPLLTRSYLEFRNELGTHHLVYEEVSGGAPMKDLSIFRDIVTKGDSSCEMEIFCQAKAFCTGECKNMYYEFTNAANIAADRNRCSIRSFSCERGIDIRTPASVPISVPASSIDINSATAQKNEPLAAPSISELKQNVKQLEADPLAGHNLDE